MANSKTAVVYVHHWAGYDKPFTLNDQIYVHTGPGVFKTTWIDPASGAVVKTLSVKSKGQYAVFDMPPVTIDLACQLDREDNGT